MPYTPACPQCNGPGASLGGWGAVHYFRCINCGWDFADQYSVMEEAE
jgi:hypothetical protein